MALTRFARLLLLHALPCWRRSHVAQHTLPGGDGTPCWAAHASHSKARKTTTGDANNRATLPGLKCWFIKCDRERERRRTKRSNFLKGPHKTKVVITERVRVTGLRVPNPPTAAATFQCSIAAAATLRVCPVGRPFTQRVRVTGFQVPESD